MATPEPNTTKRADARMNAAAIVDAATRLLARDPDASLADIAREAGVGRVTLYGHFDSRATLIAAVVDAAMARAESELSDVDLDGEPVEVMRRLLAASWRLTHRHGALVQAAEKSLSSEDLHEAHLEPIARMRTLLERGRSAGRFRDDMPLAWQITTIQDILHGASRAVYRGEHTPDVAGELIEATVLAVLAPPTGE
ncbi:TetR/AcrR family transcriptional regulator [Gordonia sp. PKS22-38]|uniref:TetR/AcrR family transcriptional regulator n=1 Tax=Gordonia prachuapensis TaxID=3115651 RepID=A0ABU7MP54_9ACTN|nr:TetR/AcrR family transcriptional regulator [Gordonia sp. PKS22-38]